MLVALAGGVGAARFLRGLIRVHPPAELMVVGNTGDDLRLHGLAVSPDLDSVAYTLAGLADEERGWGLAGETWNVLGAIRRLGEPSWFGLGDRDIATHLLRGEADGIVLCPSNPVVSIAPILAVPGIRAAIQNAACRTVAITPIIGGAPVRGMADKLLPAWGIEVSACGVASLYSGLADAFVLDRVDAAQARDVAGLGLQAIVAPTLMTTVEDAAALAKVALDALGSPGDGPPRPGSGRPGRRGGVSAAGGSAR